MQSWAAYFKIILFYFALTIYFFVKLIYDSSIVSALTAGLLVQRVQGPWLDPLVVRFRFFNSILEETLFDTDNCFIFW